MHWKVNVWEVNTIKTLKFEKSERFMAPPNPRSYGGTALGRGWGGFPLPH